MSWADIQDVVRTTIVGLKPARSGWARTKCPFCLGRVGKADRRGSFAFWFTQGIFKCFRCGMKGKLGGYTDDRQHVPKKGPAYSAKKAPAWYYDTWSSDSLTALSMRPAIQYAESRGFDVAIRQAAGLGAALTGKYADRIVIPHTDEEGKWWGFTARKWFSKCQEPYRYPDEMSRERMFNDQALQVDTEDPALLMEGVLDSLLYWPDGMGGLGKPIEEHVERLKKSRRPVVVVLDGDAWRQGEYFMMRLRMEKITSGAVKMPPGRDPNETKHINPADIRRAALASLTQARAVPVIERQDL